MSREPDLHPPQTHKNVLWYLVSLVYQLSAQSSLTIMTDIEGNPTLYSRVPTTSSTTAQPTSIDNPYAESPRMKRSTADRILKYVRNTFYIALSTYVLHRFFRFYDALFHSPYISHEWFKIGIALTVGTLKKNELAYGR